MIAKNVEVVGQENERRHQSVGYSGDNAFFLVSRGLRRFDKPVIPSPLSAKICGDAGTVRAQFLLGSIPVPASA
jgi:hypothetical protein